MKVLYCRVATIDQKTDRQRVNEKEFRTVVEDTCSGSVFFFRTGRRGRRLKTVREECTKLAECLEYRQIRPGRQGYN